MECLDNRCISFSGNGSFVWEMNVVAEDLKSLYVKIMVAAFCAGMLEMPTVLAANAPMGQTIPGINMSAGQPTAGSIRSGMAGKNMKGEAPHILKFKINGLGRLEDIRIENKTKLHEGAIRRQIAFLKIGKPVSAKDVQRAAGLISDLSGVEAVVTTDKGTTPGSAVLTIMVVPDTSPSGSFTLDNYGYRTLGYGEAAVNYDIRNLTHEGDSLFTHIETTGHRYTNGDIIYSRPIGKNGLTLKAGYSRLRYHQGSDFAEYDPVGMAKLYHVGIEYPIHRSQTHNLKVGLTYEYSDVQDEYRSGDTFFLQAKPFGPRTQRYYKTYNNKHSHAGILSLSGNDLDKNGMTAWTLAYKFGRVTFDDDVTHHFFDDARSEGSYSKFTASIMRHQKINKRLALQLFARGQYANKNMDTTDRMGICGISGLRAYPISEIAGDHAYFTRAELLWDIPLQAKMQKIQLATYLEHGGIKIAKKQFTPGENYRHLQDIGLGVIWSKKDAWWIRADYAWRLGPEKPISDTSHTNGHFWIQGGLYF